MAKIKANPDYVREVETDYDKLSERANEVDLAKENKDIQKIILELKNTIRNDEKMTALSANQIGYDKRIICLNFNGDIRTFINPIITNVKGLILSRETCHSIPNKTFIRTRHAKVSITYQTPLGKIESIDLVGLAANVFQHHIDHLDGLLISDVGLEIDEDFDNATDEERQEIIDMYLDSLDLTAKQLDEEIKNDKKLRELDQGAKFINSVNSGETELEHVPLKEEEIKTLEKRKARKTKKKKNEEKTEG